MWQNDDFVASGKGLFYIDWKNKLWKVIEKSDDKKSHKNYESLINVASRNG